MHPSMVQLLDFFACDHLPEQSKLFHDLAHEMEERSSRVARS